MAQFAWNVCNPRLDVWVLRPSPVWGAPARHILGQSVWMGSDCVCVCVWWDQCMCVNGGRPWLFFQVWQNQWEGYYEFMVWEHGSTERRWGCSTGSFFTLVKQWKTSNLIRMNCFLARITQKWIFKIDFKPPRHVLQCFVFGSHWTVCMFVS